jgi:branched-chain amino acid transport system substrate-binding protein
MKRFASTLLAGAAAAVLAAGTASAQVSGDVVKIGVLNDQSSVYADATGLGSVDAARMAVEDFGGQVLGKPIELVSADHQNKPDIGAGIVRRWYDVENVDVVADVPTSSVALAVQEITREKNRVLLVSGGGTSALINEACSPNGFQWTYNTQAVATGTGKALVEDGGDTWAFLTADYAFGHALEKDASEVVTASGGQVLGSFKHPLNNPDFASQLLQAQSTGAKVVGLANAGGDTANAIKQAQEFGLTSSGQKLAAPMFFITDAHAIGAEAAQGLLTTSAFYWNRTPEARNWSKRFFERNGRMPTSIQAGVYSAVGHYLKAVQAAGTDGATEVTAKMRELPVNDMFVQNGQVREDGLMLHDMYLVQVNAPVDVKEPWDYFKVVRAIPGEEAFGSLDRSRCSLVKK